MLGLIIKAFLAALLDVFRQGLKDLRAEAAKEELGAAKQKQADTEATVEAKRQADEVALQPVDRQATIKRMRDGDF